ncbi:MAG: protein-L-isoaspartate(D-aspartate) O-methyltransferase [Desulfobacterales bacterium]|jgi:protein-L-isoaspartate(D-aspartate) O-methyltransferase|nr:protein-L-isoaspartate(D-aspartate) O-methyltransferase [Desulfobacterales bacterium]
MTVKIALFFAALFFCAESHSAENFAIKKEEMIQQQLIARGIKDTRVIMAMRKVDRHLFVPLVHRHLSYADHPLPIGEGQTISQPYIVALMTELLELKGNEKVLEIGTGSGYQAAILSETARKVYTIELSEPLANRSRKLLTQLGYTNVQVKHGDGFIGWPEYAPYDAVIVTCAPEKVPPALVEQLAEGGKLVIPVGTHWQELKLLSKTKGKVEARNVVSVRFVPMLRETNSKPQ